VVVGSVTGRREVDEQLEALRRALTQVGDRWTLLLVAALLDGPRRFGALQAEVVGIAPNVLSRRLRAMEADGLVVATPYQHRPLRFSYELTARGRELRRTVEVLAGWADASVGPTHPPCGSGLHLAWWCPTCDVDTEASDHALHHL
jgi:DNA-binding HxlR family transcriptional regulator